MRDPASNPVEKALETLIFASRWILAPFYLGLALSLVVLLIKFMAELVHIAAHAFTSTESEVILGVLALVDMTLTGSLLVIVIFSGYENFVSRIEAAGTETLGWLGKLDAGTLKLKVAASIVAISSIHLLRVFMNAQQIDNKKIMWYVILHMTFVVSALLLGVLDKISFASHREPHDRHEKK